MITPCIYLTKKYCGKYNQIWSPFSAVQPFQWAITYSSSTLTLFDPNGKEPQLIFLATPVSNRLFRGKMAAGKKVCCGTQFIVFSIKKTSLYVNMLYCGKYISTTIVALYRSTLTPYCTPDITHSKTLPYFVLCNLWDQLNAPPEQKVQTLKNS